MQGDKKSFDKDENRNECFNDEYELIKGLEIYINLFNHKELVIPIIIQKKKKRKKAKLPSSDKVEEVVIEIEPKEEVKESSKIDVTKVEVVSDRGVCIEEVKEEVITETENKNTVKLKKEHANSDEFKINTVKKKHKKLNKEDSIAKSLAIKEYEALKLKARKFFAASTSLGGNKVKTKRGKRSKKKVVQVKNIKETICKHSSSPSSPIQRDSSTLKRNKMPNENSENLEVLEATSQSSHENLKREKGMRKSGYKKVKELINEFATSHNKAETAPNNELFLEPPIFYNPFYLNEDHKRIIDNLNKEITKIVEELDVYNEALYPISEMIRKEIELHALKVFPELKDKLQGFLYGSAATCLALEDSDVDITLLSLDVSTSDEYMESIEKFGNKLKEQKFVIECKVIAAARVPVIKLVVDLQKMGIKFEKERMKVDVTFGDDVFRPYVGCGVFFATWVINKICMFPALKHLILITKRLLYRHGLNISYYGTSFSHDRWVDFVYVDIDDISILQYMSTTAYGWPLVP
jgi:predicted nucleotidyltransferase